MRIFESSLSDYIARAFEARGGSDYEDFYVISRESVEEQIANAEVFYRTIEKYLEERMKTLSC